MEFETRVPVRGVAIEVMSVSGTPARQQVSKNGTSGTQAPTEQVPEPRATEKYVRNGGDCCPDDETFEERGSQNEDDNLPRDINQRDDPSGSTMLGA